jgi:hypothetical protein
MEFSYKFQRLFFICQEKVLIFITSSAENQHTIAHGQCARGEFDFHLSWFAG